MRQDAYKLRQILGAVIESMGYELVGVEFHRHRSNALLRVYIDKQSDNKSGIDLDDCQRVSHQISGVLDVEDPIPCRYTLEVSSPGLDRPLFEAKHFSNFAGHRVQINLAMSLNGKKKYIGLLKGIKDGDVIVEIEGAELSVPLERIEKARLVPDIRIGKR